MVTLASSNPKRDSNAAVSIETASKPVSHKPEPWPGQRVNGFPGENTFRDLQFKLAHNLQSSLDLHTTLELFFENLQEAVELHGIVYQSPDGETELRLGSPKVHTANYNITSENYKLGNIEFSRSKRFLEAELVMLEIMVGVLLYPLRNALLYQQALKNSFRDGLTGVGNRRAFDASFEREIKLAKRHQQPLSVLVLDIDNFKITNDKHGHQQGDKVLRQVSNVLQKALRETDQVFRYGGEEFVTLLNNTELKDAQVIAERLRVQIAMTPTPLGEHQEFATVSMGLSQLQDSDDCDSLFERADKALYRAKAEGRNCVRLETLEK